MQTHDARFDGRFFVGVTSTGIYCRPICTVKTPKRENCRFFAAAAIAEANGFRPCLRCRPELAPGNSILEVSQRLAQAAARLIENGFLGEQRMLSLATHLGVTDRHLRRIFNDEFGVPLVEYAQTQRLLVAKRLLTDTSLPITEVALVSGFASLRRFNSLFKERYRLKPTDLRKQRAHQVADDVFRFSLGYRPPYNWPSLLAFLAARAIAGVEYVADDKYIRSVSVDSNGTTHQGWVEVSINEAQSLLSVRVSASLARSIPIVLTRLKRLFDVDCDPEQIEAVLGTSLRITPGLRVPGAFDGFETATRAILGQQVSVKAATTLAGRIAARYGQALDTPYDQATHTFPTAGVLAKTSPQELGKLGLPQVRAASVIGLARAVESGDIRLDVSANVATTIAALQELPGVGVWTAQYIAMRALSWPDAFPHTDLGIKKALRQSNAKKILAAAESWRPWRAYATMNLWQSLQHNKGA
jgi:AraC family transcriptional regulator of adaptative response / DNA-3-methyladenine glycosylase II